MPGLKHPKDSEILLTEVQTKRVLLFFFPSQGIPSPLTNEDRAFAQALLVEAIDASNLINFVEILWKDATPPAAGFDAIKDIARDFCRQAIKIWFRHSSGRDLADPKIYQIVKDFITVRWRSELGGRLALGEYTTAWASE